MHDRCRSGFALARILWPVMATGVAVNPQLMNYKPQVLLCIQGFNFSVLPGRIGLLRRLAKEPSLVASGK